MIILDTNVISEIMEPFGDDNFDKWFGQVNAEQLATTSVTKGEIYFGIEKLPEGKRKQRYSSVASEIFNSDFSGKIIPFDEAAAEHFGLIAAALKNSGKTVRVEDTQIAAIALLHSASVATRNVKHFNHFEPFGIKIINPWD